MIIVMCIWRKIISFHTIMCDFRLMLWHKRRFCFSGILRGVDWQLFTDVSGQPISPIFKGQAVFCQSMLRNIVEEWKSHTAFTWTQISQQNFKNGLNNLKFCNIKKLKMHSLG